MLARHRRGFHPPARFAFLAADPNEVALADQRGGEERAGEGDDGGDQQDQVESVDVAAAGGTGREARNGAGVGWIAVAT